jgi:phospholipid/cholesterol/gamma-HCH transport system permease protein
MGIAPVRFLVAPALVAMLIMVPCLTAWSNALALLGGGLYVTLDLGMSLGAYFGRVVEVLSANDLLHGLIKSAIFGVLITVIGVVNGAMVTGGAEGVGRAATRAVVQSISAIVITDMLFVLVLTR